MGLSKKTLLYSTILSIIIVLCLVGYFIWMLPSLYVAHMQMQNYNSAVKLQEDFMQERSYKTLDVKNPMNTISVEIPFDSYEVTISGKFFEAKLKAEDKEFQDFLDKIHYYGQHADDLESLKTEELDFSFINNILNEDNFSLGDSFQFHSFYNESNNPFLTSSKLHTISSDLIVSEASITDGASYYSTYMAVGKTKNDIVITFLFAATPKMEEIKPVVMGSIPMIIAVAFLMVLISSQIFSRFIINPIIRLAMHAHSMQETEINNFTPVIVKGNDEISALGQTLNELYQRLLENHQELEEKNESLAKENKRQEVFLRSSSHQLKTPVSAALLLTDGMIQEVGKYKDTRRYLPQLKQQLQSMQRMIEDILLLNHSYENMKLETCDLETMVDTCIGQYRVIIEEKNIKLSKDGTMDSVKTDELCIQKILENLISNAVLHTPSNGTIKLYFDKAELSIINYGVTIPEELLPHIFEPFVTSNTAQKGHGIGLYVAAYYAQLLGCQIIVHNLETGVVAKLIFK